MHRFVLVITAAVLIVILSMLSAISVVAQSSGYKPPTSRQLIKEIGLMDRELFDAIFNKCDIERLRELVTDDFEFYHDESGQIAKSGKEFVDSVRGLCERQKTGEDYRSRRVLIGRPLVYPLNNYGAVQTGVHRFYPLTKGKPIETARFTHLWKNENGKWKLARVLSYDHKNTR